MQRLFILALLVFFSFYSTAQPKRGKRPASPYKGMQWWTGVNVGANLTGAEPQSFYPVIVTTVNDPPVETKTYQAYNRPGFQFGLSLKGDIAPWLTIGLTPAYVVNRYNYISTLEWTSEEVAANNLRLDFDHTHSHHYIRFPLSVSYVFMHKPVGAFVQGGGYYGWTLSGSKKVEISGVDHASGSSDDLDMASQSSDISNVLSGKDFGILAGAGVFFPVADGRLTVTLNYMHGLSEVADKGARFDSDQFVAGSYDAIDDISLKHLSLAVELALPMKFVTSKDFMPVSR